MVKTTSTKSLFSSLSSPDSSLTSSSSSNFESLFEKSKSQFDQISLEFELILNTYKLKSQKLDLTERKLTKKEKLLKERELHLNERETIVKEHEEYFNCLEKKLSITTTIETKLGKNQKVKLDIGGKIFVTTLSTLTSVKDTFFTGYFNDHFNPTVEDDDNSFFIDRPNEQFHLILNYLRGIDIKCKIASLNECDLNDFIEEIVYYQLTPIYEILPSNGIDILRTKYSINSNP
ncbi:predicted protein [Naegleria gruberi]|uniref:Predicted protein n=1 Tax=Naegleria gruberi TaxID=5762 RepID=D2W4E0_NAEGR|nr:uncharacterized protein NAEGRDRAFT_76271 [Naegleria gruberi]EFC36059.1 predicted protein [Naegleria gruberi]|eukprot:XP_002668803.1 predicted protein [Naegleria gruberi strain NEG-M]